MCTPNVTVTTAVLVAIAAIDGTLDSTVECVRLPCRQPACHTVHTFFSLSSIYIALHRASCSPTSCPWIDSIYQQQQSLPLSYRRMPSGASFHPLVKQQ